MTQDIIDMLAFHGFVSPKVAALAELNAAAEGLVGVGQYDTVEDMVFDLENGGTFLAPADTPPHVIHLVFTAAFGSVPSNLEAQEYDDRVLSWGEA